MITKQEAARVVEKFNMTPRKRKELRYTLFWNDSVILTTAIPKGKGTLRCSDKFRNQLRLSDEQLRAAIRCPFKLSDYIAHLKSIGKIEEEEED